MCKGAMNKFGICSQWRDKIFEHHLSYIKRKRGNECSSPLELALGVSLQHWLWRKDILCAVAFNKYQSNGTIFSQIYLP
jgi:hypothetical protein